MDGICYIDRARTPLGSVLMASDGSALIGLWFDGQKHFAETLNPNMKKIDLSLGSDGRSDDAVAAGRVFGAAKRWLEVYFSAREPGFLPPLAPVGTLFQRSVWNALLTVPYGKTCSYADIARSLGLPVGASRACAQAIARNPISLIIPCHRVIASSGHLTGYAGGIERKRALLELEKTAP